MESLKQPFMKRIAIAKTVGFIIGIIAFFLIPLIMPDASLMFRWGMLFWITTIGGILGVMGVMNYHPVLKMQMSACFRGALIGGFLQFVLVLLAYNDLSALMDTATIFTGASPFWLIVDGIIIGIIIDKIATKKAGEGPMLVEGLEPAPETPSEPVRRDQI